MDLMLEDSGDEGNSAGRNGGDGEVDENILLNSDDEEGSPVKAHSNHVGVDEEELLYEGDEDEFLEDEPEDVLDLELGEDELETPDSTLGHVNVKLRAGYEESHGEHVGYEVEGEEHENSVVEDETGVTSTEDHEVSESPSSSRLKSNVDSDDEEGDSPRHRTRFLTERKTEDISKHSGPSEGNPITTLGERNQRPTHMSPNSGRGSRGGFSNRGNKHFGQRGGQMMQGMRQRPPSLLGDRPRPALLRFPSFGQPHMHPNDHMRQLQGGFIDFNKPIVRPIHKSPLKSVQPTPGPGPQPGPNKLDQDKNVGVNQTTNMPNQVPTNITVMNKMNQNMNKNIRNPGGVIPNRAPGPRPMMNRPMRPPRPVMNVMNRPNPFLMDPNLQGQPPRGPRMHQRPPMHPVFRPQWNQQPMGPRGIPVLPGPGGNMMPPGGGMEEPYSNYNNNGPPGGGGILGQNVPFPEQIPPNGFRQPFHHQNQPRFPPPEEMMHPPPQHQIFMNQNFPMEQIQSPHQQPFMRPPDMDFQRHRAPGPQMHFNNNMPPQQQQPLRPNEFRFQGPPEQQPWPMQQQQQQQQQHPDMQFQQQQQPPKQHPPPNSRPFERMKIEEEHRRPNPFFPRRREDDFDNGSYEDARDARDRVEYERYRVTNYESKSYESKPYDSKTSYESGSRDYRDKDYDYEHRYDDYDFERASSQFRPPLKRTSEAWEDYRPEKRGYGSPEKRLDGRLGPPVQKSREVHEDTRRQEEAMKITRESQKVMGVDNDYLRRIEEQKEMRERILREKEHRRKKQIGGGNNSPEEDESESRREVRIVKASANVSTQNVAKPRPEVRVQTAPATSSSSSSNDGSKVGNKSIYINPRAFRGDLSAFKSMRSNESGEPGRRMMTQQKQQPVPTNTSAPAPPMPTTTTKTMGGAVAKKRTILRIVRNKKGEIISKSKVVVLPKGSLVGGSTTTNQQHASK